MKRILIIHGFDGSPNGGWRPWLMGQLEKQDIYACSLAMPSPDMPLCTEWVEQIARHVEMFVGDEVYLVGHSLGGPTILRYLESDRALPVQGAVLVSSPTEKNQNRKIDSFLETTFNIEAIRVMCQKFAVIQGDNDTSVPMANAEYLAGALDAELILVPNGGHLNGSAGWFELPQCLEVLNRLMES